MPNQHRLLRLAPVLVAALLATAPARVLAQQEGTEYRTLTPPRPTATPGKIEVTEFFSYACPHCNEFSPQLHAWLATQQKDVVLRRVPVGFNRPPWINLARAFYALKSLGLLDQLDAPLFNAIHEEHQQLFDEDALANWVAKNGGSAEKFAAAYTSFGVNNETVQGDAMAEDYGVDAVPTLAVDGRYVALGNTFPEILKNTAALVARARAAHAPAARPAKKAK